MTINCNGNLIDFVVPKVMGIINRTPDSFFDGGKYSQEWQLLAQVEKMIDQGATFIDVGGYSSRPGAEFLTEDEELMRVLPAVESILKRFPDTLIAIDTFRSKVAAQCIEAGAMLINDISAGSLDTQMMMTVAKYQVPYLMMHMRGTPDTMQHHTSYIDIIKEIRYYFSEKLATARALGINDFIIDPGFGFAKTLQQNYKILDHLELFNTLGVPILTGISRKSMVYKALKITPEEALNGTTCLHTVALMKGVHMLRVHDVKEAMECITLTREFRNMG